MADFSYQNRSIGEPIILIIRASFGFIDCGVEGHLSGCVSIVAPLPFSSRAGGEGNRVTGDEPGSKRKSETLVPIGFWETLQLRLETIDQ
jgi:hypothetical protein